MYMGELRYAVGGSPISHSLSPLLFSLVFHHLKKNEQIPNLTPRPLRLIESVHVDEVLGWGYIEHDQHNPDWAHLNSRLDLHTTQLTRLVEEVLTRGIHPSFEGFEPSRRRIPVSNYLPSQYYGEEVWMNLTSPLKSFDREYGMPWQEKHRKRSFSLVWAVFGW